MHLPGRLRTTTLGDLLGALHRAGATGTLELAELRGRRRARDRGASGSSSDGEGECGADRRRVSANAGGEAWRVLGVAPGADAVEVKRAYRRLARETHPDLHPHASADERRSLALR